jgi:hypothetical protein
MTLKLYYPQAVEDNVLSSALITMSPLVAYAPWRPVLPYALLLVGLDAFNEVYG